MAALQEERSYGLSCGRASGCGNVSVLHVKLTDSALKALGSYRSGRSLSTQPSISFAGNQGKILVPRSGSPGEVQVFRFYLSNVGKDNPQGSFDCVRQYIDSVGCAQLDCVGGIQQKITVCACDDSYQKALQSMAQAKEETRDRGAIIIKPGGRYVVKKVHVRKPPAPSECDVVPCRQTSRPVIISSSLKKTSSSVGGVRSRPLRDRLLHLLALKSYSRPEMVVRLQRDGLTPQDRHSLDSLLQQVADLNRDGSFTLKDALFGEVQKEWPGYTEADQQLLKKIIVRKMCQPQTANLTSGVDPSSPHRDQEDSNPPQKRSGVMDFVDPLSNKKPRISHLVARTVLPVNKQLGSGREAGVEQGGGMLSSSRTPLTEPGWASNPQRDVTSASEYSRQDQDRRGAGVPALHAGVASQLPPVCGSAPLPLSQPGLAGAPPEPSPAPTPFNAKFKKKSKKHKDKEKYKTQEKKKDLAEERLEPGVSELSAENGTYSKGSAGSPIPEKADYLLKYTVIVSQEQRQRYKTDFNVEYSEYRSLHARIQGVTRHFTVLDSQLRQLQPGSNKYKTIHNQILQEYRKIKRTNPKYAVEKNRCEYLHSKLAHIKKLIAEYDRQHLHTCP